MMPTGTTNLVLRIKKLHPDAIVPKFQHDTDAGMDLCSLEDCVLQPGERRLIPTGIAIGLPRGWEAQVRPRSGLAIKHGISIVNSPGTVDEEYRGDVSVMLINLDPEKPFPVSKGDRIAQMVVKPCYTRMLQVQEVEELDETSRNTAGFGSTGVQ